jgi:hypothetical protein
VTRTELCHLPSKQLTFLESLPYIYLPSIFPKDASISQRIAQSFVTCREYLLAVTLSAIRPDLCHCAGWCRAQRRKIGRVSLERAGQRRERERESEARERYASARPLIYTDNQEIEIKRERESFIGARTASKETEREGLDVWSREERERGAPSLDKNRLELSTSIVQSISHSRLYRFMPYRL